MARNKYPEQTVERILAASSKLFLQKGYEKTTMQDILDELKLSKGAIYHHFKSKEEILSVVIQHWTRNELELMKELVTSIKGSNGKEKMQNLIKSYLTGALALYGPESKALLSLQLREQPSTMTGEFVTAGLASWMQDVAPIFAQVLEEGVADGSIQTDYPLEAAEVIIMLFGIWAKPRAFDRDEQQIWRRLCALKDMLCKMGFDVFTDSMIEELMNGYRKLYFPDVFEEPNSS